MKRFFALFAALTLFCTGISAQTAACRTETGIAYRDATGDGYVDSLCRLDICWPADRKGFPTVVWFHGGGLTGGRREIPKALCVKGFAVVGVDYRLAPRVKVADCVADAAAAAAWVVKNIASYGGDPRLIFIAGHSAGGYLTSMIGL
ncbi:secreted protein containing Alpha/beta hydrolase fold-3 domain protein, partial [human gut metagenome]